MKPVCFIILFLLLFAGCGNDVASCHDVAPYSAGSESSALEESSSSVHNVVPEMSSDDAHISSAEMLPVESSSSISQLEQSSSSEGFGASSSSSKCWAEPSSFWCPESSSSSVLVVVYGEMTDERDGQVYKTVYVESIDRTWMIQNLNYAYLQPTAELDSSSWCQNDDPENCGKNGRLYIWSAAMDSAGLFSEDGNGCGYGVICDYPEPDTANFFWYWIVRGVCPAGWHLPNSDEWSEFVFAALGGYRSTMLAKRSNEVDLFDSVQPDLSPLFFDLNSRTVEYWESEGPWNEYANSVVFTTIGGSVYESSKPRFTKNRVRCIQNYERDEW